MPILLFSDGQNLMKCGSLLKKQSLVRGLDEQCANYRVNYQCFILSYKCKIMYSLWMFMKFNSVLLYCIKVSGTIFLFLKIHSFLLKQSSWSWIPLTQRPPHGVPSQCLLASWFTVIILVDSFPVHNYFFFTNSLTYTTVYFTKAIPE